LSVQVCDHFFRVSPRSTSLHEAGSKVAQFLGGFSRDLRARRALGC
jgi:hypothetical protein